MFEALLLAILAAILPLLQQFINDLFAMVPIGSTFIDCIPAGAGTVLAMLGAGAA